MRRYFNQKVQILDTNGDPVPGAKLEFFEAGTSNQLDTYSDYALTTPNTNPVVCDSGGFCTVYLKKNQLYDYTCVDSSDVTVYAKVTNVGAYEPPLTTKGDIFGFDTDFARIPVGTDGYVLTADSAQALGVKWAATSSNALTTKGDLYTYDTADTRLPVGNDGAILSANSGETTGLLWAGAQFKATNTAQQGPLTNYTWTTVQFDSELRDDDGAYNNSTYTYTAPGTGWYAFWFDISMDGTTDTVQGRVLVNGSTVVSEDSGGSDYDVCSVVVPLTAADTVVFQVEHLDGTNSKSTNTGMVVYGRRLS